MSHIIDRSNIRVKVDVVNWQQAIQEAGKLLVDRGSVTEEYVQNMIKAVEEMGPYIVIAPHIAIAHARPDDTVLQADISIITLKKPVKFGNKENDPVNIVFAFSAKKNEGHLKQLVAISELLENEEKTSRIAAAVTVEDVYNMVNDSL